MKMSAIYSLKVGGKHFAYIREGAWKFVPSWNISTHSPGCNCWQLPNIKRWLFRIKEDYTNRLGMSMQVKWLGRKMKAPRERRAQTCLVIASWLISEASIVAIDWNWLVMDIVWQWWVILQWSCQLPKSSCVIMLNLTLLIIKDSWQTCVHLQTYMHTHVWCSGQMREIRSKSQGTHACLEW